MEAYTVSRCCWAFSSAMSATPGGVDLVLARFWRGMATPVGMTPFVGTALAVEIAARITKKAERDRIVKTAGS